MTLIIYTCLQALNVNEREVIASLIACSKDEGYSCDYKWQERLTQWNRMALKCFSFSIA